MAVYVIPLINQNQTLQISLLGVTYALTLRWNALANSGNGLWYLDLNDTINNEPILNGIPMVAGIDLLKQFKYLGIRGHLITYNTTNPAYPPGYSDLGVTSFLYFIPYAA